MGLDILRLTTDGDIFIDQPKYLHQILARLGFGDCTTLNTKLDDNAEAFQPSFSDTAPVGWLLYADSQPPGYQLCSQRGSTVLDEPSAPALSGCHPYFLLHRGDHAGSLVAPMPYCSKAAVMQIMRRNKHSVRASRTNIELDFYLWL